VRLEVTLDADIFEITPQSYLKAIVGFGTKPFNVDGSARVRTPAGDLQPADIDNAFLQSVALLFDDSYAAKANEPVLQSRVCCEVLRRHLKRFPPTPNQAATFATAEGGYLLDTYLSLLDQIGTSFDEIRLARTYDRNNSSDLVKLQAICDRLGITLGPVTDRYTRVNLLNHLAQLCFDPKGTPDIPLVFQLTVTDSAGNSASASVQVTLYGLDWPLSVSAAANQTVNSGMAVTLNPTFPGFRGC